MSGRPVSQHVLDHFRREGREWVTRNPDPERDAEVTHLLRQLRKMRPTAER